MLDAPTQRLGFAACLPAWAIVAFIAALAVACGSSEYRTEVRDGFEFCRFHGTGHFVMRNGGIHVPPDIVDFRVVGDHAVGRLAPPDQFAKDDFPDRSGYFIANLRTNGLLLELGEDEFRSRLAELGIDRDLDISGIPTRYDTSPVAMLVRRVGGVGIAFVAVTLLVAIVLDVRRRKRARAVSR